MEDKEIEKLIKLYEKVIHGSTQTYGMIENLDSYYKGSWDEQLDKIETLKQELGIL